MADIQILKKLNFKDNGALFSKCKKYRYALWRSWDDDSGLFKQTGEKANNKIVFIGLNPSTADETKDDPTVRRCKGFAKRWGYGGMVMLNIFAYRATDPKDMMSCQKPVGELNDQAIVEIARKFDNVVCCWGTHGDYKRRGFFVYGLLDEKTECRIDCLGCTTNGHPKHPLYLGKNTERIEWRQRTIH